jgi:hypothetical protein
MLPLPAPGVSRPSASDLMRAITCGASLRTRRLLVRVSTATAALGGVPGEEGVGDISGTTRCSICAMSIAEALASRMICTSAPEGRSMERMIRSMRRTFSA